jgi:hypothetical protein
MSTPERDALAHTSISHGLTPKLRVYTPRLIKNLVYSLNKQIAAFGSNQIVIDHPIMFLNKVRAHWQLCRPFSPFFFLRNL